MLRFDRGRYRMLSSVEIKDHSISIIQHHSASISINQHQSTPICIQFSLGQVIIQKVGSPRSIRAAMKNNGNLLLLLGVYPNQLTTLYPPHPGMCPGSAHGLSRGYPDCAQSRPRVCSVLNWIDHIVLIWSNSHDTGALGSAKIKQYACCCGCIKALHHIRAPGASSNF